MDFLHNEKHCSISLMEDVPCLFIIWKGCAPTDEFIRACDKALEIMKKHKLKKILTDNTQAKVVSVENQKWLNEQWLPRAERIGYYASASVITDKEVFVKYALENITKTRDKAKFKVQFFDSIDKAKQWLMSI